MTVVDNFQKNLQILIGKKEINQALKLIVSTIPRNIIEKQKKFSIKTQQALKLKKKRYKAC